MTAPPPILIGTRGWDEDCAAGDFYPPEVPREWRLMLYSNQLRAVLVPAATVAALTPAIVRQWAEDTDPAFRFVLEYAPGSAPAPAADLFATIGPLRERVGGMLVRCTPQATAESLQSALGALAGEVALCVDLPAARRSGEFLELLARHKAGLCWHVGEDPVPRAGGDLLVAVSAPAPPREQRRILEQLSAWGAAGGQAALFVAGSPEAADNALQWRLVAELMAV